MKYGLSELVTDQLLAVFARYADIESVYLFGSRATGHYRDGSDIDLAILAPKMDPKIFSNLWNEVDALPIVFKVDCLHFEELTNNALKEKILREGVRFYPSPAQP